MSEASVFSVTKVTKTFDVSKGLVQRLVSRQPKRYLRAVDDVSFSIHRGRTLSLVGESGCGKSTMARVAVGLYAPTQGDVQYEGRGIFDHAGRQAYRQQVNMIFQDPYASLNPRWRVEDIIAEPIRTLEPKVSRTEVKQRVAQLLLQVGLTPADGNRLPHEFSGGQRQRLSIARALSTRPHFLICDEPTSALDVSVQAQILNLMRELQDRLKLTYLFISHNLSVVRHMSDNVGVMYLGRLVELGPAASIFSDPRHPYTRMLMAAIPDARAVGQRKREVVTGEIPNPINPPTGCPFHPRCPMSTDRCRQEKPVHRQQGDVTVACHMA